MSEEKIENIAWRYLYQDAPILFLHLDHNGKVFDANQFTQERIVPDFKGKAFQDIFLSFAGPLELKTLVKDSSKAHLLHVVTQANLPESFWVKFLSLEQGILVFGHLDADETGKLRKELISLNNKMNSLNRELQKKNKELEELNNLKNQFLGMAAHDLRKPVSAVLNYAEFLLEEAGDALNDEQLSFLKTIYSSTDLMLGVIDDFLDISLIESGKLELECRYADIREPLNNSVSLNQLAARRKEVELNISSASNLPQVMMDKLKIEQVLNNLLSNAIEHSPQRSEIQIKTWINSENMMLSVTDSGPGIDPQNWDSLFKPFNRGSNPKISSQKSVGLGLAISKKIIEAHQGNMWIEENNSKGATFVFSLPLNFYKEKIQ